MFSVDNVPFANVQMYRVSTPNICNANTECVAAASCAAGHLAASGGIRSKAVADAAFIVLHTSSVGADNQWQAFFKNNKLQPLEVVVSVLCMGFSN